ncbi:hypothetical protein [Spirillospora sp. CA-294931]|uniref:hypothetical protein n=1 Tax=Spirillospora sp. CA-294931 TaxID=3240042 RepID=UPI003D910467
MIYTLTSEWLSRFAFRDTDWKPVLFCTACMRDVGPEDGCDNSIEDGIDLEQAVRWSHTHTCPTRKEIG